MSRGVECTGKGGTKTGFPIPVLFSFNAAKSGRCLQRKIKAPRSLAVCLSVGFLFLAVSFFLSSSSCASSFFFSFPRRHSLTQREYALIRCVPYCKSINPKSIFSSFSNVACLKLNWKHITENVIN